MSAEWRKDAACRDYPHAWWFADGPESKMSIAAKAICLRCNVARECLDYAMSDKACRENGIWAGTTPAVHEPHRADTQKAIDLRALA